jgi:hypothetical protein
MLPRCYDQKSHGMFHTSSVVILFKMITFVFEQLNLRLHVFDRIYLRISIRCQITKFSFKIARITNSLYYIIGITIYRAFTFLLSAR